MGMHAKQCKCGKHLEVDGQPFCCFGPGVDLDNLVQCASALGHNCPNSTCSQVRMSAWMNPRTHCSRWPTGSNDRYLAVNLNFCKSVIAVFAPIEY
jgi:hypothetical protein